MNISGEMYVNKNDWGWYTTIKNKDLKTNETIKFYLPIKFRRDIEPDENIKKINVNESFLACYRTSQDTIKLKLVIMEYDEINKNPIETTQPQEPTEIDDLSELPF